MEQVNPNGPEHTVSNVDRSRRTFVDYIERTRAHYLIEGFNNPYRWSYFDDVPFTPMAKPACDRYRKNSDDWSTTRATRKRSPTTHSASGRSAISATVPSAWGIGSPCGSVVGWPR